MLKIIIKIIKNLHLRFFRKVFYSLESIQRDLYLVNKEIEYFKIEIAKLQYGQLVPQNTQIDRLDNVEMKVFSQMGEDGIIQFLTQNIDLSSKKFIEFGVEDYVESNTRYLLMKDNWDGLVIDGSKSNIEKIINSDIYWRHNLKAIHSFIDKDNINQLFVDNGFSGDIGLMSIDIDGNDYWIWECINSVNPDIVVCEYNSLFGNTREISIPYNKSFILNQAHYSYLYFGASLGALCFLADSKGYYFVGSNSNGSNAFFVKKSKIGSLKINNLRDGYVKIKSRSSRDEHGKLSFKSHDEAVQLIRGLPVVNVRNMQTEKF